MTGDERRTQEEEVNAAAKRAAEEDPERDLEGMEALAEAMLRRCEGMERMREEMGGWEGFRPVAQELSGGETERTRSEARRILEGAASLRRKLGLPGRPGP